MGTQPTWLARLREAFVEQGYFSLKPLPRTRAEVELDAQAARADAPAPDVRLGLDDRAAPRDRPDSL
jgi:hypothetical protein